MNITNLGCCGVKEITGLAGHKSAPDAMRAYCKRPFSHDTAFAPPSCAFTLFTAPQPYKYGHVFAAFILKNKLGDVQEIGPTLNPNSGNRLQVWVWTVDRPALEKWYRADLKKE